MAGLPDWSKRLGEVIEIAAGDNLNAGALEFGEIADRQLAGKAHSLTGEQ